MATTTPSRPPRRPPLAFVAVGLGGALVGALVTGVLIGLLQLQSPTATPATQTAPAPSPSPTVSVLPTQPRDVEGCPAATVPVSTAEDLEIALAGAEPGDVITLSPGVYAGEFSTTASGTQDDPIWLCGTAEAVLQGEGPEGGYVFHLDGAQYWRLQGFTVTEGQKGVMADGTVGSEIRGLTVHQIGDEAIHLRRSSTDNVIAGNTVSDTGLRKPKFGEGVYVGTAESNWCEISDCQPDLSDRNVVEDNTFFNTTAEAVDIKEGTSSGIVRNNTFDGSMLYEDGADSWVDVKGNDWLIEGNAGTTSVKDGYQTHEIVEGWGTRNVFRDNSAVGTGGFGFSLTPVLANVVECGNTVTDAREGYANVDCR